MISHPHSCIFVHIPKTAGQSVESVFLDLQGLSWEERRPLLLYRNDDPAKGPSAIAHLLAREYVALGHIAQPEYIRYFKFAFVRNPWARLVSEFEYRGENRRMGLEAFFEDRLARLDSYSDRSRHIIPQTDYVTDGNGQYIVDFIGRFETLAQDFATVARHLNLPSEELPHRNKAGEALEAGLLDRLLGRGAAPAAKRPWREYYTSALRDRVGDYYAEDIARFGYSFDGAPSAAPIISTPISEPARQS
ncbi:sulfotransferase family 2 domain-containing protein [Alteraurantiacibacter palmitatis]|uniref:Sulfotransferase family 2 domain-containing protein n=1 Tax=Alteraurantiacibacter palmitatis TaxID=2054628 RepID=A0ABV7E292_9SPHN